jgi:hypothetical protein
MSEQEQVEQEAENQEEKSESQKQYEENIKEIAQLIKEEEEENERKRKILRKKGLVRTFAYHCLRCNYTWLPKDFDIGSCDPLDAGNNIIKEIQPKSCARCKSKIWNISPINKTKRNPDPKNLDRWTKSRIEAEYRRCTRNIAEADKRINFLQDYAKKKGFVLKD